jgi:hypothetical protein
MKKLTLLFFLIMPLLISCEDDVVHTVENSLWKHAFETTPSYKYHLLYIREDDFSLELYVDEVKTDSTGGSYTYDKRTLELIFSDGEKSTYAVSLLAPGSYGAKMNLIKSSTDDAPGIFIRKNFAK